MSLTEQEKKIAEFIKANTPDVTGDTTVSVSVKKGGKIVTKTAKAKLFASVEELIAEKYNSSMEYLVADLNNIATKAARAVARQAAHVVLAGPAKSVYAEARKAIRFAAKFDAELSPRDAFERALQMFSYLGDVAKEYDEKTNPSGIVYDESKIVKEDDDEDEENEENETES